MQETDELTASNQQSISGYVPEVGTLETPATIQSTVIADDQTLSNNDDTLVSCVLDIENQSNNFCQNAEGLRLDHTQLLPEIEYIEATEQNDNVEIHANVHTVEKSSFDIPLGDNTEFDFITSECMPKNQHSEIYETLCLDEIDGKVFENAHDKKKKTFLIGLSVLFFLLAVAVVSVMVYVYIVITPYASYDKIFPNVYCAGINLGGMTVQEAESAIKEALASPSYSVKVVLPDSEYIFEPAQEGITLNAESVALSAYSYGRSDTSAYGMYRSYLQASETECHLTAETILSYSTEDIQEIALFIYHETAIAATDSTIEFDESTHTVTVTLGNTGRRIDPQDICDAVNEAFETMNFTDIVMEYDLVELDYAALKELCDSAAEEYYVEAVDAVVYADTEKNTIEITTGTQGWILDADELYQLVQAAIDTGAYGSISLEMGVIEPSQADISEAVELLSCDAVEPYYSGGVICGGTNGYTLDIDEALLEINSAGYGAQLSIAMTVVEPNISREEMESVLFRDQLSSYSTAHTTNSNRTTNLTLACKAIDGTVINPGETFSFNGVVGERTAEKGYKSATVYVGTESAEEIGGGICQVASTIYDAALYAEMEITSRTAHTFFVTYVPGGLDATVYWGSLDFCFKNNTDYPIKVNASVSGGYVHISIDGTKTNDHVVKLSSTQLSSTPYSTEYVYSSDLKTGKQEETTSPYTGYVYEAYQYIYDGDGNLLETNYLGKSTYKKRDRVITIGTG